MRRLAKLFKTHWTTGVLGVLLTGLTFIYATHLDLHLIPKGYDLLFHLGNVFSLQVAFSFSHLSLASLFISPVIFHDYGYGTHLFYPPLAHALPAVMAFMFSKIGIHSTLLAVRLFSFLTIFASGAAMFFAAKKITRHTVYASFAALLYLSAPYLQWDYYWRGGLSSSLCFVFLPILLLSLFYFVKERYRQYFFALVVSMTLLMWTHMITAFYSFVLIMLAIGVQFFFVKNKRAAVLWTIFAGVCIAALTSPFWVLFLQQQALQTHVINSASYPFTIATVAESTIPLSDLFDTQIFVWQWQIRNMFAAFNAVSVGFFIAALVLFASIKKHVKDVRFFMLLAGGLLLLVAMVTTSAVWRLLPSPFAYIQFPPRLVLHATPIAVLLMALPLLLVRKVRLKVGAGLSAVALGVVWYTFLFNNYQLYDISQTDYTTFSIVQATGVDDEYLPVRAKLAATSLEERQRLILPLTNTTTATPSASIIINETPYLFAKIENNRDKETVFELPRLFYAGYQMKWKADDAQAAVELPYTQSERGLITVSVTGNGTLESQFTGGKWYFLSWIAAVITGGFLSWLLWQTINEYSSDDRSHPER